MAKINIITSGGTEKQGQALAEAIQQKFGAEVSVSSPTPTVNPRDMETLGRMLDTLAVLRETEAGLRTQAEKLINDHPELVRGSDKLSLDDRIANTVSNRQIIQDTYGDQRPVRPPEQMIRAGAQVATSGTPRLVAGFIETTSHYPSIPEETFLVGLHNPVKGILNLPPHVPLQQKTLLGEIVQASHRNDSRDKAQGPEPKQKPPQR